MRPERACRGGDVEPRERLAIFSSQRVVPHLPLPQAAEGLAFLLRPYPEQARGMASILRLVDEDGLAASLDELVGPEVLVGLRRCQALYEPMVEARMVRTEVRSIDLVELRRSLQRAIVRYANAVLTMVDEDEPESLQVVTDALRPIDVARARLAHGRTRAPSEADEPSTPEAPAAG